MANQGDVAAIGFDTAPLEKLLKKNRVELRKEEERKQEQVRLQFGLGSDPNQELSGVGQTMGQRIGGGLNKIKEGVLDAASIVKVKAQNAIIKQVIKQAEKITTIPSDVKPPRFLDLGGFGTVHRDPEKGYVDVFSNEESLLGGTSTEPPLESKNLVDKGDFYVRIKDLRDNKFIYFRGFVTGITENVTPTFSPTRYIGRSEQVHVYSHGERDITFNLRVLPANKTEFRAMYEKLERLTSLAYPEYKQEQALLLEGFAVEELDITDTSPEVAAMDEDELNNQEPTPEGDDFDFDSLQFDSKYTALEKFTIGDVDSEFRMLAPFCELYMGHIGTKSRGQFGYFKSITYTVNEQGDWDSRGALPRVFDISLGYQILHRKAPSINTKFYGARIV